MCLDPQRTPGIGLAPRAGVEVIRAEVDRRDVQVGGEIRAGPRGEGVRAVRVGGDAEAFLADADHVVGVEALDVGGDVGDPGCEDVGRAAGASWLVGQFPGEHGSGGLVSRDDGGDVGFVLCLCGRVGVPCCHGGDAVVGTVSCHTAVIGPVVDEVDDERDAVCFGGLDDVVEALQTIDSGVDDW